MPAFTFLAKFTLVLTFVITVLTISWDAYFPGRGYWCNDETGFARPF